MKAKITIPKIFVRKNPEPLPEESFDFKQKTLLSRAPYYTWLLLTDSRYGDGPHPLMANFTEAERAYLLVNLTRTLDKSEFLTTQTNQGSETVLYRVMTNLFNAYMEWLGNNFRGINTYGLVSTVLENFDIIDEVCGEAKNYRKDFILKHLSLGDPNRLRYVRLLSDYKVAVKNTVELMRKPVEDMVKI